ncbi:MAG: RnfABCDGE type electron transport complex subunit G [Kiritimatiellae bacterium]|nr:RnfABCDGE type electron transport complex subunit G [Kiritimatiellia bacterium]
MKILKLIVCLSLISAICAGVLAAINVATKDSIKEIRRKQTLAAAAAVMPASVDKSKVEPVEGQKGIFIGRDASGNIAGYAVEGSDPSGYGGVIVLMVGFTPDCKISTYQKLVAMETPGLGTNLSSPLFMKQFEGMDASTPLMVKKDGGKIEAITSATITSRAVCGAINDAKKKMEGIKK